MSLISARGLTVRHGGVTAISDVDFAIAPGEIVTVLGPNGSGKSSLIRALIGLERLAAGQIRRKPGLRLGYVPQKLHIEPGLPLSVRRFLSLPRPVARAEAEAVLERTGVPGLGPRPMLGLSGGQLQRVLLARALLGAPELLILDEPTQGLDQIGEAGFYRVLDEVRSESGAAVLMVSHDLHVVMSASDRVICLNGHICCEGTPELVSAAPAYRALFGTGTGGALALYRHHHDHDHEDRPGHDHTHPHHHDHHTHGQGSTHGAGASDD